MSKYNLQSLIEIGKLKKFILLETEYLGYKNIHKWQCINCYEIYLSTPDNFIHGSPICNNCKFLNYYKELAISKNGICLSNKYIASQVELIFKCLICNEVWKATPSNIKQGSWCWNCHLNTKRLTIEYIQEIAISRNGMCLSEKYKNAHTDMIFSCNDCNLPWKATAANIIKGTWCPYCPCTKHETMCREILQEMFDKQFIKARYDWLKNPLSGRLLELDGYCAELGIAFEFNGSQHYEFHPKFHETENDLLVQKARDEYKILTCVKKGVKLIIINYDKENSYNKNYLKNQIIKQLSDLNILPEEDQKSNHSQHQLNTQNDPIVPQTISTDDQS